MDNNIDKWRKYKNNEKKYCVIKIIMYNSDYNMNERTKVS